MGMPYFRNVENTAWIKCTGAPGVQGEDSETCPDAWPIGSVFVAIVGTAPATLLGFGVWTQVAIGRFPFALDIGDVAFDVVKETGGAKTQDVSHAHDITTQANANMTGESAHDHGVVIPSTATDGASLNHTHKYHRPKVGTPTANNSTGAASVGHTHSFASTVASLGGSSHHHHYIEAPAAAETGGSATQDTLPPYFVVIFWKRDS